MSAQSQPGQSLPCALHPHPLLAPAFTHLHKLQGEGRGLGLPPRLVVLPDCACGPAGHVPLPDTAQ